MSATVINGFLDDQQRVLVRLRVRGAGDWSMVTAEIDTGAEPALVTSAEWAEFLAAESEPRHAVVLANGASVPANMIAIEIEWLGSPAVVVGVAFSDDLNVGFTPPGRRGRTPNALIGRALLASCRLTIDYGRRTVIVESSEGLPA